MEVKLGLDDSESSDNNDYKMKDNPKRKSKSGVKKGLRFVENKIHQHFGVSIKSTFFDIITI
jgi:hypothetical protein